ncbi:FtsH protease activity modulator HflK [Kistimonas asteriae]|uniref:FtsH protease activity modulator HflK n=1 Tax=Kistimonas asteriae TaxID=517724 RepID=UPI001BAB991E|nr:FtsH protease activity modulator HflK [Kistimonas asteriae]
MAWNEPGGNKQDPWGGGNRGGNQGPPDLDEALRKFQQKLSGIFGGKGGPSSGRRPSGGGGGGGLVVGAVVIAIVAYLFNAIYVVDEKERAVILRFGKYVETVDPGLHMYFPPFETKFQDVVTEYRSYPVSQEMLTEDENIVEVALSVQYNISNLQDYVLNVANPDKALKEATQSALRHVVGSSEMHSVLTEGREVLGDEVKERLQTYLNNYGTGLYISKVNVESAHPPKQVQAAFDDVIRAREDEERAKNEAEAYANQVVPEARGDAQRILEEANGYREEVVSRSEGEAERFTKLLAEYKKAPGVTRERLYLDTMQDVLGSTSKVLVDVKGGNNMMYLPLDKLMEKQKKSSSSTGATGELTAQELDELADRVTAELNRRASNARTGRSVR